jgi:hypothetical protein
MKGSRSRNGEADVAKHAEKEHSMKHRWPLVTLGVIAMAVGGAPFAWADQTQTVEVPAPPSEAHAVALQVEKVLTIGETAAKSGEKEGTASANALAVGGNPLVAGQTGGSQTSDGTSEGALIELEEGALKEGGTDVEVTPYDLSVKGDKADSRAALARVGVQDIVRVDVLQSESHTTYSRGKSTGKSFSDGVHVCVLGDCKNGTGLEIVVLHSESASEGKGGSHVLRLNDVTVLSDEQVGAANEACGLTLGQNADPVLFLQALCASAAGGQGTGGSTTQKAEASVANASLLGETAIGNLFDTAASGATAPAPLPPAISAPAAAPEVVAGAVAEQAAAAAALPAAALAVTGSFAFRALMFGLGLLLIGAVIRSGGLLAGSRS